MSNLDLLTQQIVHAYPIHEKFITQSVASLDTSELNDAELYIKHCLTHGLTLNQLAAAYVKIIQDVNAEQFYFMRNGTYRYSTFSEVANQVYFDPSYMRVYMYALALSGFFWPNHREIYRFFNSILPRSSKGHYLEIGPGHGFFLKEALLKADYTQYTGLDISPTSLDITRSLLQDTTIGVPSHNWDLIECDFLKSNNLHEHYDAIIMGEVLEHVEDPAAFLNRIYALAHSESFIYITTCLNSPAVDHIYLYETPLQLEKQIQSAGLTIVNSLYVAYTGKSLDESVQEKLPINVAFQLSKS
ncbi:MAG: class I SAM-dependent methyltransferase [Fibrobacterales bacterium]